QSPQEERVEETGRGREEAEEATRLAAAAAAPAPLRPRSGGVKAAVFWYPSCSIALPLGSIWGYLPSRRPPLKLVQ
uniref:Uncharacterized protein n=1 Tax=Oryza meridionalis TaxID=40149 RepID=A0A0E0D3I3_9ORYZ